MVMPPNAELPELLEAALLATGEPLSIQRFISLFKENKPSVSEVKEALEIISKRCAGRGFELKRVSSGYRFQVHSDYAMWIAQLWGGRQQRFSRVLLETIAIIAYKQPVTRGDIEQIRGVSTSSNIIRSLLDRGWIQIVGHRETPGHPKTYATTRVFLDYFNLNNLDDLPEMPELSQDLAND